MKNDKEGDKMINKKEVKKKYKQTVQPMGVYRIRNLVNGKIFLGSSKNLQGKENSFKFISQIQNNSGYYMNRELSEDYVKYGMENFIFEIVDRLEPKEDPAYDYTDDLKVLEELWLEKLQPFGDKGYNTPSKER